MKAFITDLSLIIISITITVFGIAGFIYFMTESQTIEMSEDNSKVCIMSKSTWSLAFEADCFDMRIYRN